MQRVAALHIEHSSDRRAVRGAVYLADSGVSCGFRWRVGQRECPDLAAGRAGADGRRLVVWSASALRLWNSLLAAAHLSEWVEDPIRLLDLAVRTLPGLPSCPDHSDLAARVDLPTPDPEDSCGVARFFALASTALLARVPSDAAGNPRQLGEWIREGRARPDFSRFGFGPEFLDTIPESPGVYLMRNRAGHIIYVGQSSNLRRRVRTYFTPRSLKDPKVSRIHSHLYQIEVSPTPNPIEALILETKLIRDFQPPVNLQTEVHEQDRPYGQAPNAILLVPSGERVTAYFLFDGRFAGAARSVLGRAPGRALCARVRSIYFGKRERPKLAEPWETELVARWFAANRREINFVDVDEAGSPEETIRRLASYLGDPDRLARRVIYR